MSRPRPTLEQTTRLVARALGMTPQQLQANLRIATLTDLPAVLNLRSRILANKLDWDDSAYLTWRYRLGANSGGQGDLWVLERQGQLLAVVGTEDLQAQWQNHRWTARSTMDIMVEPDLGDIGLGAWLNLSLQNKNADLVLAIGSNPHSFGLVKRLFDELPNRRSFVYPLRFDHLLAKHMPFKAAIRPVAALSQWALKVSRRLLLGSTPNRYRIEAVSHMNPDWRQGLDALLAHPPHPLHLHLQRTAAYLDWRVLQNPKGAGRLWGLWDGKALLAYATTHCQTTANGCTALLISDMSTSLTREAQAMWRPLLRAILDDGQSKGHEYATITSYNHVLDNEFKRIGARQRFNEYETLAYTCSEAVRALMPTPATDWTLNDIHTDRA